MWAFNLINPQDPEALIFNVMSTAFLKTLQRLKTVHLE